MPKATDGDGDALASKIEVWLNKHGYPLEMETARTFRSHGFSVLQSDFYTDPETSQQREIDVVASQQAHLDNDGPRLGRVSFIVECKSTTHPWVAFSSAGRRLAPKALVAQRLKSLAASRALAESITEHDTLSKLALGNAPSEVDT